MAIEQQREKDIREMEQSDEGRSLLEKYASLEGGDIGKVDWQRLIQDHETFLDSCSDGVDDLDYTRLLWYLEAKKVLVLASEGGRGFFPYHCQRGDLSPFAIGRLHFSREVDAKSYGKAFLEKERGNANGLKVCSYSFENNGS
jgi:hypothetical protein